MKVQARMEDKVRIKNLKSLLAFFEKFGRGISKSYLNCGLYMVLVNKTLVNHEPVDY